MEIATAITFFVSQNQAIANPIDARIKIELGMGLSMWALKSGASIQLAP
jgi:hypothetical protein